MRGTEEERTLLSLFFFLERSVDKLLFMAQEIIAGLKKNKEVQKKIKALSLSFETKTYRYPSFGLHSLSSAERAYSAAYG